MCGLAHKKLPDEIPHAVAPYAIWMLMSKITLETCVLFGRCFISQVQSAHIEQGFHFCPAS